MNPLLVYLKYRYDYKYYDKFRTNNASYNPEQEKILLKEQTQNFQKKLGNDIKYKLSRMKLSEEIPDDIEITVKYKMLILKDGTLESCSVNSYSTKLRPSTIKNSIQ